ncbi:DUF1653 domain-containing protein [Chitinilyticum piscinae]|uniref:DUF1653 domain-containing protein n=1 Tax=Chitinilyticum piscinae TaxID=2866724 RepID=A0A8J7KDA6_9NEIS|nr:DUF1653 domain-containing protein [Chitinilyticum piscinae]MBE9608589.1 DUF1653 domain-containing protein [Chitinilyticum piscinae]
MAASPIPEEKLPARPPLTLGRYRHYKGNEYDVIDLARHSETLEWLVVYRPRYGEGALWVRPYAMFIETVEVAGQTVARFAPVDTAA